MRPEAVKRMLRYVRSFQVEEDTRFDYARVRKQLTFDALSQGVYYAFNNGLEGHIAEFGTASGFSALTIAHAMAHYAQFFADFADAGAPAAKRLFLFDSFKGLPPSRHDVDLQSPYVRSGRWGAESYAGLTRAELEVVLASVYPRDHLSFFEGWFSDTLPTIPEGTRFCMVHLDCDLYASTREVLDHLFSNGMVAEGAVLFFDDWNCNRSSPRLGQRRAWREVVDKFKLEHTDCGEYGILSRKFIVHGTSPAT